MTAVSGPPANRFMLRDFTYGDHGLGPRPWFRDSRQLNRSSKPGSRLFERIQADRLRILPMFSSGLPRMSWRHPAYTHPSNYGFTRRGKPVRLELAKPVMNGHSRCECLKRALLIAIHLSGTSTIPIPCTPRQYNGSLSQKICGVSVSSSTSSEYTIAG